MRSNFQKRIALMSSLNQHVSSWSEMRSQSSHHVFSIIDLAKWAPRRTKTCIRKMNKTNEAAGLIVVYPSSAQNLAGLHARC
jgi:DUF438 domain-containing protein